MTLIDLYEKISKLPLTAETAKVMIKHELVGYEHETMDVEYDEKNKILWIKEKSSINNTAKWIIDQVEAVDSHNEIYYFDDDSATCSRCGNVAYRKNRAISETGYFPKYCDECGAKMEQ